MNLSDPTTRGGETPDTVPTPQSDENVSPRTEAGRALLDLVGSKGWPATVRGIDRNQFADFLVRVEAEAAALVNPRLVPMLDRESPDE